MVAAAFAGRDLGIVSLMPAEEERDDDAPAGAPLPPDDRLWRHPSEVGQPQARTTGGLAGAIPSMAGGGRRWGLLVAGLAGATLTLGVVAMSGVMRKEVVERRPATTIARIGDPTPVSANKDAGVAPLVDAVAPSVAGVRVQTDAEVRNGSAVVLGPAGHLVTSRSLVGDAPRVTVVFSDGSASMADVVGADAVTGLAVLGVHGHTLTTPKVAARRPAVGSPSVTLAGSVDGGTGLVSAGVVRGLDQPVTTARGELRDLVQTDQPPSPGSDGGAVLGPDGAVTGICLHPSDDPTDPASLSGWAVPIDVAERVVEDIAADGRAHHAWLGVDISEDVGALNQPDQPSQRGAVISTVSAGSPAQGAGLRQGDQITAIGGTPVASMADVISVVRRHRPGDRVAVTFRRDGQDRSATITLRDAAPS